MPTKSERKIIQWRFRLPLDAREIDDALTQVEREFPGDLFDDRYKVISDGEDLIFSWEKSD